MSKVYVADSKIQGRGVFAKQTLIKGEIVLAIDDSRVVTDGNPLRADEDKNHCDWFPDGTVIYMQEPERYINHSCDPNTFTKTVNGIRYPVCFCLATDQERRGDYL